MRIQLSFLFSFILLSISVFGQEGVIKGRVYNGINNEPIPFANIVIEGTTTGVSSDLDGNYELTGLENKLVNLQVTAVGFKPTSIYEIQVFANKVVITDIALEESVVELEAAEVTATPFSKKEESPVSMRTIGVSEIERNPGGNRDISRVIQSLPGVASSPSFRNDIIIRGGAPNENRFYLDGIEVPNINHFATQGSSGGPVGMINVNFIREVDFYSGAFPANRGNAMSSVFEFKQKDGNSEKLITNITLGSSDLGITLDGPIGKKSTFIFSARRSYLQFLFKALQLPFLPIYNDAQFKYKMKLDQKNQITVVGLGALDDFELNPDANDGITDPDRLERNQYILGNVPENSQWNYTVGANYQHFGTKSFQNIVISRNHLKNIARKYVNNDSGSEDNLLYDYSSQEIENKLRLENTIRDKGYKINYGAGYEYVTYTNSTFNNIATPNGVLVVDFSSRLNLGKYSAFGQVSKTMLKERLVLSLGVRTDFSDYSEDMINPIEQLSPRFSAAYTFAPRWSLNFNVGRYYQLPSYTVLGYRDDTGALANKDNEVTYIQVDHLVAGLEYGLGRNAKVTLEGFYKQYDNYPFLLRDSVSLANLGADFGVIGNSPTVPISQGRSYGVEFLAQQKLKKGFYGIIAYTFVISEFQDKNGEYVPSSWDNGNLVTLTMGKKFKRNWELGVKWRYLGGAPFTPFNEEASSLKSNWDVAGQGLLDFNRLNTERNSVLHQLDFRIDKRYFFDKWSLNVYLDVQNAYNFQAETAPFLTVVRDDAGNAIEDPSNPDAYLTKIVKDQSGNVLPSIGLIIEF